MKHRMIKNALLVLVALVLAGCGTYGDVEQGRVVAYDDNAKTVTMIKDTGAAETPAYAVLPAVTYNMPKDPGEIGALPHAGKVVALDLNKKVVTMYKSGGVGELEQIPFSLVGEPQKGVDERNPQVWDAANKKDIREFPINGNNVTMYNQKEKLLVTIQVPSSAFYRYPNPSDWIVGDEVRIYYKKEAPNQILRFMNVSKTNIYKR